MSRRHTLRLLGGAAGAAGAATIAGPGLLGPGSPALAAGSRPGTGLKRIMRVGTPLIGMSSPADVWDERVKQVGPGLGARRIFADLANGATSQLRLVEEAHAAGLLPVISYKVGRVEDAVRGEYNEVAELAAAKLASYRKPTAVTFWHEPHGDMTPGQYVAASKQILPAFKRGKLRVGPILNGWLLDRQQDTFASYCDGLFGLWDWVGIDTYESGTMEAPGPAKPADRIVALRKFLKARNHGKKPIGVGEYNGYSAKTISGAGEALLSTSNVWFGCVWNSRGDGDKGYVLSGDRLRAFKKTLDDPRCADLP